MRMIRNAALAAAVALGLGLFAIGCGPVALPTLDTSKGKDLVDDVKKKADEEKKKVEDAAKKKIDDAKALADKVKTAADDAGKEVTGIEAGLKGLTDAITKGEKDNLDVAKLGEMQKLKTEATGLLDGLKNKIKELGGLKDLASLDGVMAKVKEMAAALKEKLKAYMPK